MEPYDRIRFGDFLIEHPSLSNPGRRHPMGNTALHITFLLVGLFTGV